MCTCELKEKLNNPRLGYFDYVFQCNKINGERRILTLTATNDSQAKLLAEEKCKKDN